ncbi:hypothetical protein BC938DRAFT_479228 [Jimgerdemannia flammicorona]|uniref:Dipeptidyl-peptidase V n=1 Tax=Jimgerdemannia flammicorona TaxID=994334 RepID=A0A433QLC4_9FUNG|nr:hypothetical protein BC938DRAFT_479228 [Jimgerdemannia flammicorona]
MASTTDIPDWTFAEVGLPYSFASPPVVKPEHYAFMYERSPIVNVDKIKTPTLLLIGECDRRVPPSEGYGLYYVLKGRGGVDIRWVSQWVFSSVVFVKSPNRNSAVELKAYPDIGHALDSMDAETYGFEALSNFFLEHVVDTERK